MATTVKFKNASVFTMDPRCPRADSLLVSNDRISWVGRSSEMPNVHVDQVIDCAGASLIPGLNDAHIHLLAYAANLRRLNCDRNHVSSISNLQQLVQARARTTLPEQWIRGTGYDEFFLSERRHPTRHDLDPFTPNNPVRLDHRSFHGCVLNSLGLQEIGITKDTPDPVNGVIVRDESGLPTGLLLEMNNFVSQRMRETWDETVLHESIEETSTRLLKWGVTSLQDASPENDIERWETFQRLTQAGALYQRITFMPSVRDLNKFNERHLHYLCGSNQLRIGPAKIMLNLTTGGLQPHEEELRQLILQAHQFGSPVAIHSIESESSLLALQILEQNAQLTKTLAYRDRIEHCSEATPMVVNELQRARAFVVTQPGFVYESGERYRDQVAQELQQWLYPINTLLHQKIPVAAGSDAPVASPNPWHGIYAAVTRRDASGTPLNPGQSISLESALALSTSSAAYASGDQENRGILQAGMLADLTLLDRDLTSITPEDLLGCKSTLTMIGGNILWKA
jgi:predicted amidohydrolase YtcJ